MLLRSFAMLLALLMTVGTCELQGAEFRLTGLAGLNGGPGGRVTAMASGFATGFPLALEVGIGYTSLEPGDPWASRKIFINDNTNGTPENKGWAWDFRMDFLYRTSLLGMTNSYLYAGVRRSLFTADFKFVGGNEDFEITSNQWGVGLGARGGFPIGARVEFMLTAGLDYYFSTALEGHDTAYGPDGFVVNGRENFTYTDADAAVDQPKLQPVALVGISLKL
jgi:hypothetical protein